LNPQRSGLSSLLTPGLPRLLLRHQLEETAKRVAEENDQLKHEHSVVSAKLKAKNNLIESLKVLAIRLALLAMISKHAIHRQAEQYQLETRISDKEKQLAALSARVGRNDDLINAFELNFKQVQQEVNELASAFRMERESGTSSRTHCRRCGSLDCLVLS
jgi:hypothetical protein